jgi:serine/threonine protein phosphatase PrpC
MTASLALIAEQDFAGRQALGKRSDQEDAYAFSTIPAQPGAASGLLLLVADGMGGHTAGNRASDLAVRTFVSAFHRGGETMNERFARAIDAANDALAATIETDPEQFEGMGTTLLAVTMTPLGMEWASVGDSPLYLFRRGTLRRINADHSFRPVLREMVANGELTAEQAATSSLRNRLRSALVGGEITLVDLTSRAVPLLEGDLVIAGSDGLQTLSDAEIAEVLAQHVAADAATIAARLVAAVMKAGKEKQDNITATIVKPTGDWLAMPFSFALTSVSVDPGNATLRIVPRAPTP